jgi:predicted nucleotidyltransferase
MKIPKEISELPIMSDWCILLGYRGSMAHGTYRPNSDPNSIDDIDLMGFCMPPVDYYYGLNTHGIHKGTKEIKEDVWDIVIYEFRKALRLLENGNPNLLAMLWLNDNLYLKMTPAGRVLLDNRHLFATRKVYHSFVGYAHGQLHRMTHLACKGFMGAKRKALVEKFGYDTKNASHLIRLLRQGIEFLIDGEMHVFRKDAKELLAIKDGEWALEKIKAEAERLFVSSEQAFIHSKLPAKPDHGKINRLCVDMVRARYPDFDEGMLPED